MSSSVETLPKLLCEIVEAQGKKFVRAGLVNFGASSYDFGVEFDSAGAAYQDWYDARHVVGMAIVRRLQDEKVDLAYPTQTTFTGAPDGGIIMPYPAPEKIRSAIEAGLRPPERGEPPPSSGDRSAVDQ